MGTVRRGSVVFVVLLGLALIPSDRARAEESAVSVWRGSWSRIGSTFAYGAELRLEVGAGGTVRGTIGWTLEASPRAEERHKVGLGATEFVRGSYVAPGLLVLEGYRKDDPHTIIGLDKYRLLVASQGDALVGISASPRVVAGALRDLWEGRFSAARTSGALPAPAAGSASARPLTGWWRGVYVYPRGEEKAAVAFRLRVFQDGSEFMGTTTEPNTFGDDTSATLVALVREGTVDAGGAVRFTKQYEGTGGVTHKVVYEGVLSSDGSTVRGSWTIPGKSTGTFEMARE